MRLFALIMVCSCAVVLSGCAQHQHPTAMLAYEKTILAALSETHTALSDYLNGMHAVHDEEIAMRHRQESVALAYIRLQKALDFSRRGNENT